HLADRLDPVDVAVFVDERRHGLNRRSSSAWAKYALALRRISFACRNSRFSRSSALIRSVSLVVGPGRLPWSRSACRTQRRSVSAVQPNLALIELIAAHCEPCSCWCSSTSRTARSCTSGENFADFLMAPSSQGKEPPEKPGRFTVGRHAMANVIQPHRGTEVALLDRAAGRPYDVAASHWGATKGWDHTRNRHRIITSRTALPTLRQQRASVPSRQVADPFNRVWRRGRRG